MQDPLIGTTLGHFKIEELIAEGGMGLIYRAAHSIIGKQAAIKVLSQRYSRDRNMIKRLHREARAVNRIGHPNIIDIFDFGQTEDLREYFIMEYVPGPSLAQIMAERGRLPWEFIQPVLGQTLDALASIHDLGFIHRDIKPENILVVEHDHGKVWVKLLDFGIARSVDMGPDGERLTRAGSVMGTPEYVAPEQIRGRDVDGRADLYAVGVMLFEMVMGHRPYESEQVISLLMAHLKAPIPPVGEIPAQLEIPDFVAGVIHKAMAKEADRRYQDARQFAAAMGIELVASGPPSGIAPPLSVEQIEAMERGQPPPLPGEPQSAADISTPRVDPTPVVTLQAPLQVTEDIPRPRRGAWAVLRLVLPVLLILGSGVAIALFYLRQPGPEPPAGEPGKPVAAAAGKDAGVDTVRAARINLQTLYKRVRQLLKSCAQREPLRVRRTCVKGLGELGDRDALGLLEKVLREDPEQSVRSAACLAISSLGDPAGAEILRKARDMSSEGMRVWLDEALMKLDQPDGQANLLRALKSRDKSVRFQAALALGEAGDARALPVLEELAREASTMNRQTVVALLGTLANLGHEPALGSLEKALAGNDRVMRLGAAEALVRLGDDRALPHLRKMLTDKGDTNTRLVASRILASMGDFSGVSLLTRAIGDKALGTRRLAAESLGAVSDSAVLPPLVVALDDKQWEVRSAAAESLARILATMPTALVRRSQDWIRTALDNREWGVRNAAAGLTSEMDPELAVSLLGWALQDKDARVRSTAVASLGKLRSAKAIPLLTHALADSAEDVRAQAANALGKLGDKKASKALHSAVRDRSPKVGMAAAGALLDMGDDSYVKDLKQAAKAPSPKIRRAAVAALGKWQDPGAEPLLERAMKDPAQNVRFAAAQQLARRGKKTPGIEQELRRVIGKGGARERQALASLASIGSDTDPEIRRLADSRAVDARQHSMESAPGLKDPAAAVAVLKLGLNDPDPQVRLAAASSLAALAPRHPAALPLLKSLTRDPNPVVRTRAAIGMAKVGKARKAPDMGTVKPVKPAPLPRLPQPRLRPRDTSKPLFVEDTNNQKLYKYHISQATVATSRGQYQAALRHLSVARRYMNRPPLNFEFGYVFLKLAIQNLNRDRSLARKHLAQAGRSFRLYLQRAPDGKLAPRAKRGLQDVKRLMKQLR